MHLYDVFKIVPLCPGISSLLHLLGRETGVDMILPYRSSTVPELVRLILRGGTYFQVLKPVVCPISVQVTYLHPRRYRAPEGLHH